MCFFSNLYFSQTYLQIKRNFEMPTINNLKVNYFFSFVIDNRYQTARIEPAQV
jgi:hypothetical protein